MTDITSDEQFMQDVISCQSMLYAFILSLTADPALADDILQETNLSLLRKKATFKPGTNFKAWASSQAFYGVMTNRQQQTRSRLVFDDALIQLLADESSQLAAQHDSRQQFLRECLALMDEQQRDLLNDRYSGRSVQQIADDLQRPGASVSQSLYRLRRSLKDCVERRLLAEKRACP